MNAESRFLVSDKKVDWAGRTLRRYFAVLSEEDIWDIAAEVGLHECLSYNDNATGYNFEGTDLQTVALAAAIATVGEIREMAE